MSKDDDAKRGAKIQIVRDNFMATRGIARRLDLSPSEYYAILIGEIIEIILTSPSPDEYFDNAISILEESHDTYQKQNDIINSKMPEIIDKMLDSVKRPMSTCKHSAQSFYKNDKGDIYCRDCTDEFNRKRDE